MVSTGVTHNRCWTAANSTGFAEFFEGIEMRGESTSCLGLWSESVDWWRLVEEEKEEDPACVIHQSLGWGCWSCGTPCEHRLESRCHPSCAEVCWEVDAYMPTTCLRWLLNSSVHPPPPIPEPHTHLLTPWKYSPHLSHTRKHTDVQEHTDRQTPKKITHPPTHTHTHHASPLQTTYICWLVGRRWGH